MIASPSTLAALQGLRVDVVISGDQAAYYSRSTLLRFVRERASAQLTAAAATYAVDLHPADLIFSPIKMTDGPLAGSTCWRCTWAPLSDIRAELVGGPRDGELRVLESRQMFLVFMVNPPRFAHQPHPLERVIELSRITYALAGYDTQRRVYVYEYEE